MNRIVDSFLVTFPAGDQSGRRLLSRHEARVLRLQLHLAYLLAGRNFWTSAAGTDATEGRDRMKLQRVEISEDERAELLTQHQQGLSATAKRLNVRPAVKPRALSSSTGRTQNGTSWSRRPSLPMKVAADSLQASFRRVGVSNNRCNGQIHRSCERGGRRL